MSSSTYRPQKADDSGKAAQRFMNSTGFGNNETRRVPYFLRNSSDTAVSMLAGVGGLISSIRDLVQWVEMLFNDGIHRASGTQGLPKSAIDFVTSGHVVVSGKTGYPETGILDYGAGWIVTAYQGHEMIWHNGGAPGVASYVALFPRDKLGIVVLSNGDYVHMGLLSLLYRVAEDVLKLQRVDWPARFLNRPKSGQDDAKIVSQPQTGDFILPLKTFSGTYSNPGYGTIMICAWRYELVTTSASCEDILSDYFAVDPGLDNKLSTTLYASFSPSRIWFDHVRFVRQTDTTFRFEVDTLFPKGYGKDLSPFVVMGADYMENSFTEFLVVDGRVVGFGLWDVDGGGAERIAGNPKESSDVWLEREP